MLIRVKLIVGIYLVRITAYILLSAVDFSVPVRAKLVKIINIPPSIVKMAIEIAYLRQHNYVSALYKEVTARYTRFFVVIIIAGRKMHLQRL